MHRRAGTQRAVWTLDQQRTAGVALRAISAALHPGNVLTLSWFETAPAPPHHEELTIV
jgi:hypothetical protein